MVDKLHITNFIGRITGVDFLQQKGTIPSSEIPTVHLPPFSRTYREHIDSRTTEPAVFRHQTQSPSQFESIGNWQLYGRLSQTPVTRHTLNHQIYYSDLLRLIRLFGVRPVSTVCSLLLSAEHMLDSWTLVTLPKLTAVTEATALLWRHIRRKSRCKFWSLNGSG